MLTSFKSYNLQKETSKSHLASQYEQLVTLEEYIWVLKDEIAVKEYKMVKEETSLQALGKDLAIAMKFSRIYNLSKQLWSLLLMLWNKTVNRLMTSGMVLGNFWAKSNIFLRPACLLC